MEVIIYMKNLSIIHLEKALFHAKKLKLDSSFIQQLESEITQRLQAAKEIKH